MKLQIARSVVATDDGAAADHLALRITQRQSGLAIQASLPNSHKIGCGGEAPSVFIVLLGRRRLRHPRAKDAKQR